MLFVPRQVALAASSSRPPAAAAAAAGAAMAKEESKKEKKSKGKSKSKAVATAAVPDVRAVVVASVAAFLEAAGFPRALAELQAEANLEAGAWKSSAVSLEELVSKFLESSSAAPPSVTVASNEQAEDASKKKKDNGIELNGTGNDVTASSAVQVEDETGEKKKKKKKKGATEASEPETKAVEPPTEEKPAENVGAETKEKKHRKKKKDKDESSAGEAKETVKGDDQKVDGKKKSKKQEGDDDDIEARLDKASLAIEKKKEKKLASEVSEKTDTGTAAAKAIGKSGAVETAKDDNDKKAKKKRKKSGSEENGQVDGKQADDNGSVPKPDNESKSGMEIEEGANGKPSGDNVVVSKKRKLEDVKGSDTPATENGTANQNVSNGSIEDDSKENSTASKPSKRQKMSNEPKSVTPFQRVKLDAVKFADERLQDNSYWAKGGAEIGYGAKAQEVLGQVRGRGFRHEKTKKKRGTYRGGHIDLGTHSIKFNNSDDEE